MCQCFSHITSLVLRTFCEMGMSKGLPKPVTAPYSLAFHGKDWPPLQQAWPHNPRLDNRNVDSICLESSRSDIRLLGEGSSIKRNRAGTFFVPSFLAWPCCLWCLKLGQLLVTTDETHEDEKPVAQDIRAGDRKSMWSRWPWATESALEPLHPGFLRSDTINICHIKPPLVDFSVTFRKMYPDVQLLTWGQVWKWWSWGSHSDLSDSEWWRLHFLPLQTRMQNSMQALFYYMRWICLLPFQWPPSLLLPPWFWMSLRCQALKHA